MKVKIIDKAQLLIWRLETALAQYQRNDNTWDEEEFELMLNKVERDTNYAGLTVLLFETFKKDKKSPDGKGEK